MLEKILKLYTASMLGDVRSPLPHLFGPPGCGKSTAVEQAAELLGCNLHIVNVSRLSPLELEGVQMPESHEADGLRLRLLHATLWTQLKEGDILLLDEFLRGFPEVYNGLLDILTSRQVGGLRLPKVFIIAASNSTATYDPALEDRLLHLPVPDIRQDKQVWHAQAQQIVEAIGLLPEMTISVEMRELLQAEVEPTYKVLDSLGGTNLSAVKPTEGTSTRNLIGQAKLREVKSPYLAELIHANNRRAAAQGKWQYLVLVHPDSAQQGWLSRLHALRTNKNLTPLQAQNIELNIQLLELEKARNEKEGTTPDDDDTPIF